ALVNEVDSVSYALGLNVGTGFGKELKSLPGGKVNKDALLAGFIQSLREDTSNYQIDIKNVQTILSTYFQKAAEEDKMKAMLKNDSILSENKKKEGVVVTESGLQYKVLTEGKGPKPTKDDIVKVNYTGKLVDGTIFDSSVQRGDTAKFPVGAVIPGWSEALQLMPVGSKWELMIPSQLAYGERNVGSIPANSVLIFEVEMVGIEPKAEAPKN
ncbi:MAG TPA: FKBP-type peptidyl-prolyl cis-trans isomerase, partial [Paludibacteraceae bacterium]|nr:FKBP-type peptidyl-prolyl cis-trans isomerase [Paludibacteraceae bacterium]